MSSSTTPPPPEQDATTTTEQEDVETTNASTTNGNNDTTTAIPKKQAESNTDDNDYYVSLEEAQDGRVVLQKKEIHTETTHLFRELYHWVRYRNWKKKLLTAGLGIAFLLVFYDLIFSDNIYNFLNSFLEWMSTHSFLAVLAFIGIFVIATLIFIPPSILIFGAGFAFAESSGGHLVVGILNATIACFVGSCLGAIIAFFRARYMMRDLIHLFAKRYPLVRAFDRALKLNGFRVMVLLRLCPLIPFNGLNYIGGITGVKWEEFTLALVGVLPSMILMVAIGATAGSLAVASSSGAANGGLNEWNAHHQVLASVLIGAGLAFGIIAVMVTWYFAKKELEKEMQLANYSEDQDKKTQLVLPQPPQEESLRGGVQAIEMNASGVANVYHVTKNGEEALPEGVEANYQQGEDDEEWFWIWA